MTAAAPPKVGEMIRSLGAHGRITGVDKVNQMVLVYFGTADGKRIERIIPWTEIDTADALAGDDRP